ncbi:bifunctional folylpolyglutamate synthase/dihydrofolate synthase [bacterium]|nr:bifunctional folylpolyglutamate synthase/dihydrofolate synthase [bacterium]
MCEYDKCVKLLTSQGKFYINLGLERIEKILALYGNPQDKLKCIHVAGTNGKGSTCAILASILNASGRKVGLYTSPHIFKYTERIQINGEKISENTFSQLVFETVKLADDNNIHLTEFEILTAVMFKYFADENVDVVILETGLGGRFDATNVIKSNLCSIITHIDYDHTERLGNTLDKIAYEKAGIIKENCPVISSQGFEILRDEADKKNSLFLLTAPFADTYNLALKGLIQQENLALALAAINLLFKDITSETIQDELKNVKHPCRFQIIEDKNLVIDASHNPNGISALRESLDFYYPDKNLRFVFGCLKNKDYKKMVETLFRQGDEIYFYHFKNPNSCTVEELKNVCKLPSSSFKSLDEFNLDDGKITVICGSFYMLNEIVPESLVF